MRFSDAHSASAVCSPSRYSVLTGRYAWRTWLKNCYILEHMPMLLETDRLTLPIMLREKGYKTGCVGKWHLGWGNELNPDWDHEVLPGPLEAGFDYFFGIPYSHESSRKLRFYVENRRVMGLPEGASLDDAMILMDVQRHLTRTASRLSEVAVTFIERNHTRPFFLYYPTVNVHLPYTPASRFRGTSDAGIYGSFVVEFDWAVGEILDALDRFNIADNTIVVVTSDNGGNNLGDTYDHYPNDSLRGFKGGIYEGGHRVPFIVRWPGRIAPGSVSDEIICQSDMMATIAEIIGYKLPKNAGEDSYSLVPVLTGKRVNGPIREATVHHSVTGMFAIRQGKWKYIDGRGAGAGDPNFHSIIWDSLATLPYRDPVSGRFSDVLLEYNPVADTTIIDDIPGQLYDLEADPSERVNLWKKHPDVVDRLSRLLKQYRREDRSRIMDRGR
jgi:arylsulfatase A-like enzyme